ncbi:hypothetical protein [Spongiibacter sp. UBA1325]|uniref:hypothetical protein n=1 Tax=Spongiibacter sp. UBA1325 TaxID=1947543 RepID=UPI00258006B3|nr:hypothetical protein [Spongiibacter sp. UBA1325]
MLRPLFRRVVRGAVRQSVGLSLEEQIAAMFGSSDGFWLDPSDPSTVFQDAAGTIPAKPGDPVGLILDKSGNGTHLSHRTATSRPILRQSGGYTYLESDGVDDVLVGDLREPAAGIFMAITFARRSSNSGLDVLSNLDTAISTNTTGQSYLSMNSYAFRAHDQNYFMGYDTPNVGEPIVAEGGWSPSLGQGYSADGGQIKNTANGVKVGDNRKISVCARSNGFNPSDIEVYGALVICKDPEQIDREIAREWLAQKAGVTLP